MPSKQEWGAVKTERKRRRPQKMPGPTSPNNGQGTSLGILAQGSAQTALELALAVQIGFRAARTLGKVGLENWPFGPGLWNYFFGGDKKEPVEDLAIRTIKKRTPKET